MDRVWKAWRGTIVAVVAVIAIASLASASPSLRRGPQVSTGPTGTTAVTGPTGATGVTGPEIEPVEEEAVAPTEGSTGGPDFTACEGMTGLDNAICRHEALLVVHPDNQGLQNSLGHLQENKGKHETSAEDGEGDVPPEDGSTGDASSSSSQGHGGGSHGNAGGNGHGNGH